jgi:hypothetical protein
MGRVLGVPSWLHILHAHFTIESFFQKSCIDDPPPPLFKLSHSPEEFGRC